MAFWKQSLLCLLVVVVAAALWMRFFPGAPQVLAGWGIDWAPAATTETSRAEDDDDEAGTDGESDEAWRRGGVVAAPIAVATINDRLMAIGTGRALSSVVVTPFTSGRLTEVRVRSGATVDAGEEIARLDSDSEQIAVDRASIALADSRARLERVQALRTTNTITAVQETEAELEVRNAELALREAELALERRSVTAPISGVVGILPVSEGNYITSDTEVATIDDRSKILVDFWVPERYAGAIEVGMPLTAGSVARPTESYEGTVNAIDNRIDADSRTLRVEARITNPADTLRAGMAFQVSMRFPGDTYPAVDPLAIQWGSEGAYVWAVQDGRARRTPVTVIQRNSESVLVDGTFVDDDMVVVEGVHNVREGSDVLIAERIGPAAPARGS